MLRPLLLALMLAASAACADQSSRSALGMEVRGDDGVVLGEVTAVERDANGEIIAVEIAGLEPADAPYEPSDMIAEGDFWTPTSVQDASASGVSTRSAMW